MPRTFDELLLACSDDVRRLAQSTRRLIRELLPGVEETIDSSGPFAFYGFGPSCKVLVCTIIVSKAGVKLGLVNGVDLDDPDKLLEGAGKRHKHIVIARADDLHKPGVKSLVRAAAATNRKRQTEEPPPAAKVSRRRK